MITIMRWHAVQACGEKVTSGRWVGKEGAGAKAARVYLTGAAAAETARDGGADGATPPPSLWNRIRHMVRRKGGSDMAHGGPSSGYR